MTGPTFDRIQVEAFESQSELKERLSKNAPPFCTDPAYLTFR